MRAIAVFALSVLALGAGSGRGDDKKVSIEGTYELIALEVGGEPLPKDLIAKIPADEKVFKITATQIVASKAGKDDPINYKLDASKTPYQMDFVEKTDGKEKKSFGICKIDGDKLIICAVESEKVADRPKEFKSTAANKAIVMTLQKKK